MGTVYSRAYGRQFGRRWVPIAGLTLGALLTCAGTLSAGVIGVACLSLAFGFAAFFAPILTPIIASRFRWFWGLHAGALVVCSGVVALYFVKMGPGPESALALPASEAA